MQFPYVAHACRGELPEELAAAHERQARAFEALQRACASLADTLERALPPLPASATRISGEGGVSLVTRQQVFWGAGAGCLGFGS